MMRETIYPEWATDKQMEGMKEFASVAEEYGNFDIHFRKTNHDHGEHRFDAFVTWGGMRSNQIIQHQFDIAWDHESKWDRYGELLEPHWQFLFACGDATREISTEVFYLVLFDFLKQKYDRAKDEAIRESNTHSLMTLPLDNLQDGSLVAIRGSVDPDICDAFFKRLERHGLKNVIIIFLEENQTIESLNEDAMAAHGWVKSKKVSRLETDGFPSFYISKGGAVCTHRMFSDDTPVWCKSGEDALRVMEIIQVLT